MLYTYISFLMKLHDDLEDFTREETDDSIVNSLHNEYRIYSNMIYNKIIESNNNFSL